MTIDTFLARRLGALFREFLSEIAAPSTAPPPPPIDNTLGQRFEFLQEYVERKMQEVDRVILAIPQIHDALNNLTQFAKDSQKLDGIIQILSEGLSELEFAQEGEQALRSKMAEIGSRLRRLTQQ